MNIKKTSLPAWLVCGVMLAVTLFSLVDYFGNGKAQGSVLKAAGAIFSILIPLVFSIVGAFILSRQPRHSIGWLLMLPPLASLGDLFIRSQIVGGTTPPAHLSIFFWLAVYLSNTIWLPAFSPVFFIALLFPTGKPLTPRWRWVVAYAIGIFVFFFSIAVFDKTLTPDSSLYGVNWSIPNPLGIFDTSTNDNIFSIWLAGVILLAILCVVSIILRYRRAAGMERKQINWLMYAISLFGTFYIPYMLLQAWGQDFWGVLVGIFFMTIPLAIGVAILRYRLYDIDIIIRRTLQYSVISGLLALTYFGLVVVLQRLFSAVSGQQSAVALVLSTLAIAGLFNPVRRRVQDAIDRRFYRKKYDAAKVIADFAATCRDETDLDKLTARLVEVVQETMQPTHVSLWLKPASPPASPPPLLTAKPSGQERGKGGEA